jgi:hypothetical protein
MNIIDHFKSWSLTITIILIIIIWYFLMQFIFSSGESRNVSLFWYSYFSAMALWAIIAKKTAEHEQELKAFLKNRYPGSRPFEFLFP